MRFRRPRRRWAPERSGKWEATMDCETAGRLISERLDGRLDEGDSRALVDHLRECRECAQLALRFEGLQGLLAEYEAPRAPSGLKARIIAETAVAPPSRRRFALGRWALAGVAAAAVALVAVTLWRATLPEDEPAAGTGEFEVVYAAPGVPLEFAELCVLLLPRAEEAADRFGAAISAEAPRVGKRIAAGAAGLPERAGRFSGDVVDSLVPRIMDGAGKAFRVMKVFGFEEVEKQDEEAMPPGQAGEEDVFRAVGRRAVRTYGTVRDTDDAGKVYS